MPPLLSAKQRRGGVVTAARNPSKDSGAGVPADAARRALRHAAAALCAAAVVLAPLPGAPDGLLAPAFGADVAKVGTCLLSKCQKALAGCLADGPCLQVRRQRCRARRGARELSPAARGAPRPQPARGVGRPARRAPRLASFRDAGSWQLAPHARHCRAACTHTRTHTPVHTHTHTK